MKNNSLQKKITKNQLLQNDTQLIRVLDIEADRVFIIDCIKRTMPVWKDIESIKEYKHENFTEKYLAGGEVTVAYNPDDVSAVWLIK